ncbi:MAG: hypothetical protein HY376_00380 [Candidatus Blackburnbacteria bacterium]|nr:hypothetical protein [Candidatus Blackburnbacteria bacterium]
MENILAQISKTPIPSPDLSVLDPNVLKLVLGGAGIFLTLALLAFTRHHLVNTSLHGLWAGLTIGVLVVLGIEGGAYYFYQNYILGSKAKNLPANFQVVLNDTTASVTKALGDKTEHKRPTAKEIVSDYRILDNMDSELVRSAICKQK